LSHPRRGDPRHFDVRVGLALALNKSGLLESVQG
jgi:hypothetical protein